MQTRFYDSAELGPPVGWLDGDQGRSVEEKRIWENTVAAIRQATRRLTDSDRADTSMQIWGSLRLENRWWIYRSIPAVGRPGRILAVIFCSNDKEGFDWTTISSVAPELEALAKDRGHLPSILRQLDIPRSKPSLTDDLLNQFASPILEAIKSEIICMTDRLVDGGHEYFTISANGTVANQGCENLAPKPPQPPEKPARPPETARPTIKKGEPQSRKPSIMKTFMSHALCLVIGLLLGFGLRGAFNQGQHPPAKKAVKNQPVIRSDEEAVTHLRAATEYFEENLGSRKGQLSPGDSQTQPQRR